MLLLSKLKGQPRQTRRPARRPPPVVGSALGKQGRTTRLLSAWFHPGPGRKVGSTTPSKYLPTQDGSIRKFLLILIRCIRCIALLNSGRGMLVSEIPRRNPVEEVRRLLVSPPDIVTNIASGRVPVTCCRTRFRTTAADTNTPGQGGRRGDNRKISCRREPRSLREEFLLEGAGA